MYSFKTGFGRNRLRSFINAETIGFPFYYTQRKVVNTYLGNQFRTDMVVYEIALDAKQINVNSGGLGYEEPDRL